MKRIRFLAIALLTLAMLAACAANLPVGEPPERMIYNSMNEFINEVNNAKVAYKNTGEKTYHKIEEIDWYYDFKDTLKDVKLGRVVVTYRYVALDYRDKEAKESCYLTLKCDRVLYENEEQYLKYYSVLQGLSETVINGHKALKGEEYWDDPFTTEVENVYTSNRYFWVENGTAIFLRIPTWLLERYPEETFFDIREVKLKKLDDIK